MPASRTLDTRVILETITTVLTMAESSARPIINAMTIDVEDYFQVSAFDGVVSRDRWGDYESRVAANTDRLLAIFAEFGVHATFFVLGWVAERQPALISRIASAGHEIASRMMALLSAADISNSRVIPQVGKDVGEWCQKLTPEWVAASIRALGRSTERSNQPAEYAA